MRIVPTLALVLLSGCQAAPKTQAPPPANLEQLLHYCQEQTGSNFTYTAETGVLLRERGIRLEGAEQRTAEGCMQLLRTVLTGQQLELVRVGPEHLNVWLVRPLPRQS